MPAPTACGGPARADLNGCPDAAWKGTAAGTGVRAAPGMLKVLAGDLLEDGIGNLARPEVQRKLERCLDGVELLILDDLASLITGSAKTMPRAGRPCSSGCCGCADARSR